jgi:hypothetical protein
MSADASKVAVGKPKIAGAIFRAPLGTALPVDVATELSADYKTLGYISEDGVTNSQARTSSEIKAWGGAIIMTTQTDKTDTFKFVAVEALNEEVQKMTFGAANVSTDGNGMTTVRANSNELEAAVYVIELSLNGAYRRIVIPNAKVSATGDIVYKDSDVIGYDTTITALPFAAYDGDTHREFTQAA